jgi:hypothetical protein
MHLVWSVANDPVSDRPDRIDSPAHEKCDHADPVVALKASWR